jgi:hypothetical protein
VKSNFLLSFFRALKLPLKLLVCWLGKSRYRLKKVSKKDYEPKFKKNERRIETLFKKNNKKKPVKKHSPVKNYSTLKNNTKTSQEFK